MTIQFADLNPAPAPVAPAPAAPAEAPAPNPALQSQAGANSPGMSPAESWALDYRINRPYLYPENGAAVRFAQNIQANPRAYLAHPLVTGEDF